MEFTYNLLTMKFRTRIQVMVDISGRSNHLSHCQPQLVTSSYSYLCWRRLNQNQKGLNKEHSKQD